MSINKFYLKVFRFFFGFSVGISRDFLMGFFILELCEFIFFIWNDLLFSYFVFRELGFLFLKWYGVKIGCELIGSLKWKF